MEWLMIALAAVIAVGAVGISAICQWLSSHHVL